MYRIKHNIIFSLMAHSVMLAAALFIGGSSEMRKNNLLIVSLFDNIRGGSLPKEESAGKKEKLSDMLNKKATAKATIESPYLKDHIITKESEDLNRPLSNSDTLTEATSSNAGQQSITGNVKETGSSLAVQSEHGRGIKTDGPSAAGTAVGQVSRSIVSSSLRQKIREALQNNLVYPYMARKRRMEGTVLMDFRINNKGMAENIRILKGSGFALLDSAAMETVVRTSPFPAADSYIEVPVTYRLTNN